MQTNVPNVSIIVRCPRPDLNTHYAQFTLEMQGLRIAYGSVEVQHGQSTLTPEVQDYLPFDEYPETRLLHDGRGWDAGELAAWTDDLILQAQFTVQDAFDEDDDDAN